MSIRKKERPFKRKKTKKKRAEEIIYLNVDIKYSKETVALN